MWEDKSTPSANLSDFNTTETIRIKNKPLLLNSSSGILFQNFKWCFLDPERAFLCERFNLYYVLRFLLSGDDEENWMENLSFSLVFIYADLKTWNKVGGVLFKIVAISKLNAASLLKFMLS